MAIFKDVLRETLNKVVGVVGSETLALMQGYLPENAKKTVLEKMLKDQPIIVEEIIKVLMDENGEIFMKSIRKMVTEVLIEKMSSNFVKGELVDAVTKALMLEAKKTGMLQEVQGNITDQMKAELLPKIQETASRDITSLYQQERRMTQSIQEEVEAKLLKERDVIEKDIADKVAKMVEMELEARRKAPTEGILARFFGRKSRL
jgi:uncharacterized protein YneF (UPF0154 family)